MSLVSPTAFQVYIQSFRKKKDKTNEKQALDDAQSTALELESKAADPAAGTDELKEEDLLSYVPCIEARSEPDRKLTCTGKLTIDDPSCANKFCDFCCSMLTSDMNTKGKCTKECDVSTETNEVPKDFFDNC